MDIWVWWILFSLFILFIELLHSAWIIFWFSLGALAASLLAYFYPTQIAWQVELFFAVSILSLIFLRPFIPFLGGEEKAPLNIRKVIGKEETCVEEINNEKGTGTVKHYGTFWPARSKNGEIIRPGERVRIVDIDELTLIVEPVTKKGREG